MRSPRERAGWRPLEHWLTELLARGEAAPRLRVYDGALQIEERLPGLPVLRARLEFDLASAGPDRLEHLALRRVQAEAVLPLGAAGAVRLPLVQQGWLAAHQLEFGAGPGGAPRGVGFAAAGLEAPGLMRGVRAWARWPAGGTALGALWIAELDLQALGRLLGAAALGERWAGKLALVAEACGDGPGGALRGTLRVRGEGVRLGPGLAERPNATGVLLRAALGTLAADGRLGFEMPFVLRARAAAGGGQGTVPEFEPLLVRGLADVVGGAVRQASGALASRVQGLLGLGGPGRAERAVAPRGPLLVPFGAGSAQPGPAAQQIVQAWAEAVAARPGAVVLVRGWASAGREQGMPPELEEARALAAARGFAVLEAVVRAGVPPGRVVLEEPQLGAAGAPPAAAGARLAVLEPGQR
ncbi:MAG: hypothetical protein KatS3mg102_2669 [Planctomycetota bacterium]|nr:MAG: hypothetical protein KatS3mg102_2669 [Planctomycetota bacterium]